MTPKQAVAQLEALLKVPGALRVITNEERTDPHANPDPRHPHHFVVHDVVKLEGPSRNGQYAAHTAEGDWCMGQPAALLARLTEVGRVNIEDAEAVPTDEAPGA